MRIILPKQSQYDWSEVSAIYAGIHAQVRHEIEGRHDADRIRVHCHNIGIMLWLYLKIVTGFWVTGMVYVALT